MKKYIALLLTLAMALACCATGVAEGKKINIVTTIFPIYDWTREIVGTEMEHVDLTLLMNSGVDLHSYQPTVQDMVRISTCDVFIYVGGESDDWVSGALQEAVNRDMKVVNLVKAMGESIKTEEIVEGMEHDHDHEEDHDHEAEDDHDHEEDEDHDHEAEDDHDHGEDEDHDHDHGDEVDEHVWLSLRNAQKLVKALAEAIGETDPDHAETYQANAAAYIEKLAELDARYAETVRSAAFQTLLFGDRFPFRYLVDDYGLDYYAAFSGCSAESEASFATIVFLARKVDELNLPAVMTIENPKFHIAETIIENTEAKNQKVLSLDSMQGITGRDVQTGVTYLSVMENNLQILQNALN